MEYHEGKGYPVIDVGRSGKLLKEVCRKRDVSPKDLQKYLHLGSIQAVYHWFRGERMPSIDNLYAISRFLEVPLDDLLVSGEEKEECIQKEDLGAPVKRLYLYWQNLGMDERTGNQREK